MDALLAAGADPNVALPTDTLPKINSGLTALMAAVTNAHGEAVIKRSTSLLVQSVNAFLSQTSAANKENAKQSRAQVFMPISVSRYPRTLLQSFVKTFNCVLIKST